MPQGWIWYNKQLSYRSVVLVGQRAVRERGGRGERRLRDRYSRRRCHRRAPTKANAPPAPLRPRCPSPKCRRTLQPSPRPASARTTPDNPPNLIPHRAPPTITRTPLTTLSLQPFIYFEDDLRDPIRYLKLHHHLCLVPRCSTKSITK